MYITHKKELFSIAFLKAISATLGFNHSEPKVDNDSVDIELSAKGYNAKIRNPKIELQLKCTTLKPKNGNLHFELPIKNYDDLRGENVVCPRYLVVVTVPESEEDWIEVNHNNLILSYSAYWISLKDAVQKNNSSKVTVQIPISNQLNKVSLKYLMDKSSEGVFL